MKSNKPKLVLSDGVFFIGENFGAEVATSGEVVFATGMTGYPEALTDPSFRGQILVMTYPLVGNYGVPPKEMWESGQIQVAGLVVSNYSRNHSHSNSVMSLAEWFKKEGKPLIEIKDTRAITQKLRTSGAMLGKIIQGKNIPIQDPNKRNLVQEVSTKEIVFYGSGKNTIVLVDCGAKQNIVRFIQNRGFRVAKVPWDTDLTNLDFSFQGVVVSNGPGDPKMVSETINNIKKISEKNIPMLGICLGNQILTLAFGGNTYKLKFGHRSQNQPAVLCGTDQVYLTTQNHGFAVGKIPKGFREWFKNGNDGTNEGIIHETLPIMSVQFHPESSPGPLDTDFIFDFFFKKAGLKINKNVKK